MSISLQAGWPGIIAVTGALTACAVAPPPVPLTGDRGSAAALAGRWEGSYWSDDGERSGSIVFALNASGDSAVGDVLMSSSRAGDQAVHRHSGEHPECRLPDPPQALRIAFVRVAGGRVSGILQPYEDPGCGSLVHTAFVGRAAGTAITGTYESRHAECGVVVTGRWRVDRRHRP